MSDSLLPSSFQIGPLSPPSPPAGSLKTNILPPTSKALTPQTPSSPPLMSVSAQNYASAFTHPQASPGLAPSQGQPLSSPLSSTPMSTQVSQQPTVSTTNSFPTPASSVSGHLMGIAFIDDVNSGEKQSSGRRLQSRISIEGIGGTEPIGLGHSGHRRTDHDRQDKSCHTRDPCGIFYSRGQSMAEDENMMELDEDTAVSTADNHLSLDYLQKDIGSAFHLCKTSHPMSGPDPSLDLVSLYGLGSVAQSVMRADPVTGEKINRLRKSYEGKLKGLGLAGRNKPVKHEPGAPGGLRQMTLWPEEEWQNQKVLGKEIKIASMDSPLYELQMNAMKMEPGAIPNHEYWEDILGHEKPSKHATPAEASKKAIPPPPTATTRQPGQPNGTSATIEPERSRPSRGKKRHYDDNSFVGYGEGYADDDDEVAFHSNSEEMGRAGKKKRKKEHMPKISPTIPERGGTYGVGMFGIGAR